MDKVLKEEVHQMIDKCEDIYQLTHVKLLLESERRTTSIVHEPAIQYALPNIKNVQKEIAKLVDEENDIDFLTDIKNELNPEFVGNFDNLSTEDREELLELIEEPFGKDCISHEEFLKTMDRWNTK